MFILLLGELFGRGMSLFMAVCIGEIISQRVSLGCSKEKDEEKERKTEPEEQKRSSKGKRRGK